MSAGTVAETAVQPSADRVWGWLAEIEDPEIPVVSIVDLGIVRGVRCDDIAGEWVVTITPTYSGCPATHVIAQSVVERLAAKGLSRVRLENRIAPAWTTDWISDEGRQKLRDYGIAPPVGTVAEQTIAVADIGRGAPRLRPAVACPRCGSTDTTLVSQFGSTPCKSLHRCLSCLEPFDLFKCH